MTKAILELKNIHTVVNAGTSNQLEILRGINLKINAGDFITVVGTNGAGKSTLFNAIAGTQTIAAGHLLHNGQDITNTSEEERTKFLSRVFQDPKLGTAPRMTVAENLLLAEKRGSHRLLKPRHLKQAFASLQAQAAQMNNGLEKRMNTFVSGLSGGQRQALSFLMATLKRPDVLLLDEHTAALDPHTSQELLQATNERITKDHLTALMITHHLDDALKYGNRLLVLKDGQVVADFTGADKQALTVDDLYKFFDD
ncbi:MAG: ATP-binding cassette domain-containing protein [Lactobacillus sp.]|jgi:putative ABC transport system ATP-binding protein|nr:ATP-binding cassette domain-containing protein [Lactobacillus sp.]MCH4068354.1 ATP-binding cassette domain-containing protein [Lactobacillus sp.]MCI1304367.1 ATP-binding cassette domain-containing protein [Lactobacillus sp.]MCI1330353.1 ATP-binding cassette domain-containing protein [Lactobacillus sp.]MCI1359138.1 ATP-binding cassette domain-containing protein [Lactobacillus sp.]